LSPLQNDKEVDILIQPLLYLTHHISLRAKELAHLLEALFLGLNLELSTELVELLQIKIHLLPLKLSKSQLAISRIPSLFFAQAISSR